MNNPVFINFLYMFRAILCLSSGGLILYIQHLFLCMSLFLGDRSVHRQSCLCTERSPKKSDIQRTRCCMYTMSPPDDEHNMARNMQRKLINIIKKWCIKLEHKIKNIRRCLYHLVEVESPVKLYCKLDCIPFYIYFSFVTGSKFLQNESFYYGYLVKSPVKK